MNDKAKKAKPVIKRGKMMIPIFFFPRKMKKIREMINKIKLKNKITRNNLFFHNNPRK
jgi:ppGpp synthetase/RelA/SpoT-type nucleotidyltranferase